MRVNIYAEELQPVTDKYGDRVFLHKQQVEDLPFKHHGIRMLFAFGDRNIHTDHGKGKRDDDTPGVTFWYSNERERGLLIKIFEKALEELNRPDAKQSQ